MQKRIPELKVVSEKPKDRQRIFFGAWVTLEDVDSEERLSFRIVGADEIDTKKNWISIDAPMAKALLKKVVDDEVTVERPMGKATFWVVSVSYE